MSGLLSSEEITKKISEKITDGLNGLLDEYLKDAIVVSNPVVEKILNAFLIILNVTPEKLLQ